MSNDLQDVVKGLVKPHAGGSEAPEDKAIIVLSLTEFAAGQRQRAMILGVALLLLLVLPIVLILCSVPQDKLALALGGTGLFTVGTAKYLVDAMSTMSTAHALAVVCQGMDSSDAREVLNAWLKQGSK